MQVILDNFAIILATMAMLGNIIAWVSRSGRRNVEVASISVDSANVISDGALKLYREVKLENEKLEKENSDLRGRIRSLEKNEIMREKHLLEVEQKIEEGERKRKKQEIAFEQKIEEMRSEMKRIREENKRLSGRMSDHESRTDWQVPKD